MQTLVASIASAHESAFRVNFLDLVRRASEMSSSDIHLEPTAGSVRVRFRVDGVLRVAQTIQGASHSVRFLHEVKRACGFDTAVLGVPQDRRVRIEAIPYDLRASLLPTLHGEKIVLRLLERGKRFSLDCYPMPSDAKALLRRALGLWQGLVLITGPTGSGKTTLLYSALSEIDRVQNAVHTIEDPIEYELDGAVQSAVDPAVMSFGAALQALMRQDPDVILIGEIRDEETAKTAVHAAATGHLVLSTIHANSASEVTSRLEDLGVPAVQTQAVLVYASAQRLVPKNCSQCLVPDHTHEGLVASRFGKRLVPKRSVGCESCHGLGVAGRVLLFECNVASLDPKTRTPQLQSHGSLEGQALDRLEDGSINAVDACAIG